MMLIPASLCEGPFFYFYVESVFLLLSVSEANTCVNFVCNNFYMLVYCTYYIALCWLYPWDIYVESWKPVLKLKSSYVLIDAFYLESIALWVNSYAKLFDACLESTIHEKFLLIWFSCLFITYLLATIDHCLGSLHSWLVLYIIIWSRLCGSMSPQKLFCFIVYLLEDEQELSLGMLDTSPTYL